MSHTTSRAKKRRLMRRRLEARGWSQPEIDAYVERHEREAGMAYEGRSRMPVVAAEAAERLQRLADQEAELDAAQRAARRPWEQPDDAGYRPAHVDPLLTGVARATGQTAAAVSRRRTMTRWQHQEREEKSA